jgi:hypothetical protein
MEHVALRGRLNHAEVSWWTRLILKMGALVNPDPEARRDELEGFDYVKKSNIDPVVRLAEQLRTQADRFGDSTLQSRIQRMP